MAGCLCRSRLNLFLLVVLISVASALAQEGPKPGAPVAEGTIAGVVRDSKTGDPIIEAGVEVVGQNKKGRTDLDGKFSIQMPPGAYELRFFAPLYQGKRLKNVIVVAGKETRADAVLVPQGEAGVEVVAVIGQADRRAEETQLAIRKNAPVVSDNVSAETIKQSPDSDVGEIVERVPAVVVQDSKYVNIRGLNERYTSALLNGNRLPSTDPFRRSIPLDLFPAGFLESISIIKTYTPDLPGDFTGGLAKIQLQDYPEQFEAHVGMSTGLNTNASFQSFPTYHAAGAPDYFGFGNGFRALPSIIPGHNVGGSPPALAQAYGRSFRDIWNLESRTAPPNWGIDFSMGRNFGDGGAGISAVYDVDWERHPNQVQRVLVPGPTPDGPPIVYDSLDGEQSNAETTLGAVLNSGYKVYPGQTLRLNAFYNRSSNDQVLTGSAKNRNIEAPLQQTVFNYTTDQLAFGQLEGEHELPGLNINWRTAFAHTAEDQPDTRFDTRLVNPAAGTTTYSNISNGGRRVFANLQENLTDSFVDFTIPFKTRLPFTDVWSGYDAQFKTGPAYCAVLGGCGGGENDPLANCGNGRVDAGEQCDDGNTNDQDDCLSTCQENQCGDGHLNTRGTRLEECDFVPGSSCGFDQCQVIFSRDCSGLGFDHCTLGFNPSGCAAGEFCCPQDQPMCSTATCTSLLGPSTGQLRCSATCTFDTSGCMPTSPSGP